MLTKITFTESQQNVNTSEIEHTCPTFTSLKNEYEARTAKLMQDMETCWNHQDIGMSIEYYMITSLMINLFVIGIVPINVCNFDE